MRAETKNDAANFRIYVADLGAYVSGRIIGGWVTPAEFEDAEALSAAIAAQLTDPRGEWALHDTEGVHVDEHESPDAIMAIARACEDWGCDKVQAFLSYGFDRRPVEGTNLTEDIAEHDGGEYEDKDSWAREYIESAYDLDKMLGQLASYFDYEAFARDAELGGDVTFIELGYGRVWAVNNH